MKLIALKPIKYGSRRHVKDEEFEADAKGSRLLIAIGKAKPANTYQTRVMTAAEPDKVAVNVFDSHGFGGVDVTQTVDDGAATVDITVKPKRKYTRRNLIAE
jgi:hypothetical protein